MKLGAKARGLQELAAAYGALVPPFFVAPCEALVRDWPALNARVDDLVRRFLSGKVSPDDFSAEAEAVAAGISLDEAWLDEAWSTAGASRWGRVSVRTSALAEDGVADSFAGQYYTALDCAADAVVDEARRCVASLFSVGVASYAKSKGLARLEIGGSVVIQRMFVGAQSGVLFTEDGRAQMTVAYTNTARNVTVEGEDAHQISVSKLDPLPRSLPVPRELLRVGIALERTRGIPLDIEWAARGSRLALLQVRPQTVRRHAYSLAWDCSNIAENYPRVTLPLTYSFIRGLYARVYPNFFRLIGVSESQIRGHEHVFRNTLGYLDGHVYYQIDNWYHMATLLPGSSRNQEFFSAMLQPAKDQATRARASVAGRLAMLPLAARFAWLLARSDARSRSFTRRFARRMEAYDAVAWEEMQADAILATLDRIRTDLLGMWAIPILNDVRVMIFHGLLKRSFGPDRHGAYLEYLGGLTDRASIAPLMALAELGAALRARHGEGATVEGVVGSASWLDSRPDVARYLDRFGGRAPDELQLENPRLADDEAALVALALAAPQDAGLRPHAPRTSRQGPLRAWLGRHTRRAIDWRERFRFNRAQVYGLARAAYFALGNRLAGAGVITDASDVFWLTEEELDGVVYGHSWDHNLAGRIAERKRDDDAYAAAPLARRMVGSGPFAPLSLASDTPSAEHGGSLSGIGVSPGRLTAEVIVVREFDSRLDVRGKILVTSHIDPGWTLLFVQAAGVITERGNALSHVAIIGRELGMPAVVAVPDATTRLATGERISMDGTTGAISVRP